MFAKILSQVQAPTRGRVALVATATVGRGLRPRRNGEGGMQTIEEAREHCRFVGKQIEEAVASDKDLAEYFEGNLPVLRFLMEKDGDQVKVVGGEAGGDDSGIFVSERGVTKRYDDQIVGYAFDSETRDAMIEFFNTLYFD